MIALYKLELTSKYKYATNKNVIAFIFVLPIEAIHLKLAVGKKYIYLSNKKLNFYQNRYILSILNIEYAKFLDTKQYPRLTIYTNTLLKTGILIKTCYLLLASRLRNYRLQIKCS